MLIIKYIENWQNVDHENILKKLMCDIVKVIVKSKSDKLKWEVCWKYKYMFKCSEIWEVKEKTNILKSKCLKYSEISKWKKLRGLTYWKWKWKVRVKSKSKKWKWKTKYWINEVNESW